MTKITIELNEHDIRVLNYVTKESDADVDNVNDIVPLLIRKYLSDYYDVVD